MIGTPTAASKRPRSPSVDGADRCPRCGSDRLQAVECPVGPHFARLGCRDCGRFVRWIPAPMTLARALELTMPFGRHRGERLAELPDDYLRWLGSVDLRPTLAKAVALVLAWRAAT